MSYFESKYSTKTEPDKTLISNDAYAVGEMIELLINKIEQLRTNL